MGLSVKTLPGIAEIVSGELDIDHIREVGIEDLLGRDMVEPNNKLLAACIEGKSVMKVIAVPNKLVNIVVK